jgi:hypothetical protein
MPYQVDDALLHAMSGTELSRVRTELRLLPEPNNQRLLMSRGADIVMQSSGFGRIFTSPVTAFIRHLHNFVNSPYPAICLSP